MKHGDRVLGARAVVVGAGMGGMMAAGMLSRFFDEVVVLDKDRLPDVFEPRKCVPQGAHCHALLVQGRRNLEKIFPGLTSDLIDRGVVCSRAGLEFWIHDDGGWQPSRDLGLLVLTMSRALLEGTVRDHLVRNERISIHEGCRIEGWDIADGRVSGVVVAGDDGPETVSGDFVVDATGRSGRSLSWLEAAGYGPVEETVLQIGTGYASAVFRKPPGWQSTVDSMAISAADPDTRGGFVFSVEDQKWFVSLEGRFDEQPTADPEEFMEFARTLCVPDLYDWISKGERLTEIKTYKAPVSRWRHFDKMAEFPDRMLPVGDVLAHVNPIFGQGMTLASTHVMDMWAILDGLAENDGSLDNISRTYFERVHRFTSSVWTSLENVEYTYSCTKGDRPADIDMRMAFRGGIRKLIVEDGDVHKLMFETGHLIRTADAFAVPEIAERVMATLASERSAAQ